MNIIRLTKIIDHLFKLKYFNNVYKYMYTEIN